MENKKLNNQSENNNEVNQDYVFSELSSLLEDLRSISARQKKLIKGNDELLKSTSELLQKEKKINKLLKELDGQS